MVVLYISLNTFFLVKYPWIQLDNPNSMHQIKTKMSWYISWNPPELQILIFCLICVLFCSKNLQPGSQNRATCWGGGLDHYIVCWDSCSHEFTLWVVKSDYSHRNVGCLYTYKQCRRSKRGQRVASSFFCLILLSARWPASSSAQCNRTSNPTNHAFESSYSILSQNSSCPRSTSVSRKSLLY